MSAQHPSSDYSNTFCISAFAELFIVFVLIVFASAALPDAFIKFMINEFGSIGSFFWSFTFYFALRVLLTLRIRKHAGGKR